MYRISASAFRPLRRWHNADARRPWPRAVPQALAPFWWFACACGGRLAAASPALAGPQLFVTYHFSCPAHPNNEQQANIQTNKYTNTYTNKQTNKQTKKQMLWNISRNTIRSQHWHQPMHQHHQPMRNNKTKQKTNKRTTNNSCATKQTEHTACRF